MNQIHERLEQEMTSLCSIPGTVQQNINLLEKYSGCIRQVKALLKRNEEDERHKGKLEDLVSAILTKDQEIHKLGLQAELQT